MSIALAAWADLQQLRGEVPLILNLTNDVAMEQTANGLLALGAAPVMVQAIEEVEEMVGLSDALVLNIGTLHPFQVHAMELALDAASKKAIPVILDPVGAGATLYRTETAQALLLRGEVTAVRANGSEVAALGETQMATRGVDATSPVSIALAQKVALSSAIAVWVSGPSDAITDGKRSFFVHNGHPMMQRITAMGCTATALAAAFLAVNSDSLQALLHAAMITGIAGEIAAVRSKGPGSFKSLFLDALYNLSCEQLASYARVETL